MPEMTVQQAFDLALRHHNAGDLATAESVYHQILNAFSDHFDAWNNLAVLYHQRRQWPQAMEAFERADRLRPNQPMVLINRGECLRQQRRLDEAIADLTRATQLAPDQPDAFYNLGTTLDDARRRDEAVVALRRAARLRPGHVLSRLNLGAALLGLDRYSEGVAELEEALRLDPKCFSAFNNLAHAALKVGQVELAITQFDRAAELSQGRDMVFLSNALLARHYRDTLDPAELFEAHQRFARFASAVGAATLPPPDLNPDRRLRIGYISPDFCGHSVAFFIEPVLQHHDRAAFELFCYDDLGSNDGTAQRLRRLDAHWFNISMLSDEELAARIVHDRIDLLVDLAGHAGKNRMGVFARRVAPVQLTYLGYPDTTGLPTMDYRLTDAVADPPGQTDRWYTERLIRLPRCAWCYRPSDSAPSVATSPAKQIGRVTFGCFNALAKVNEPLIAAWCAILSRVEGSRLIVKNSGLGERSAVERVRAIFNKNDMPAERVELRGFTDDHAGHFSAYNEVDIALDTYPYHGTTTTCDALWMGVPVVTRIGELHVSRVGASLLRAIGLNEYITGSFDDYVDRAARAAGDLDALADLRLRLRDMMQSSPLMDGPGLTGEIEREYRQMWHTFTKSRA